MFKNLKEKLGNQVTKTNSTLLPGNSSSDSVSISRNSNTRTSSITSRDDNSENNRSRLDSTSSDISQFSVGQSPNASMTYVSPQRTHMPPSDIESEYGADESDHENNTKMIKMQKLLSIYKNKFNQLKNAYDEVEREKEHIKNILQKHQDTSIKRLSELREQTKLDRQAKEQLECLHQKEIRKRENRIEELTLKLTAQQDLIQLPNETDYEEMQKLREKNSKLEGVLNHCNDVIKTHQDKEAELIKERDEILQKLNEKQSFIESMMKDRHSDEILTTSMEVQEHFDSDISVLLQDKQRLQEKLESSHLCVQQLENELDLIKRKINIDEDIKEKYDNLLIKFHEKSDYTEQLINDKTKLETTNEEFQKQIQLLQQDITQYTDLNLILSNQQMNILCLTEELNHLRETIKNIENILPSSESIDLFERIQQLIDDRQKISEEIHHEQQQNEQHFKTIDDLKNEYENQISELQQTKQQVLG
ncbi:unnamed protein product [Rotaria sp. Silwood2]|nr:unnamed protein product [Rotaria sp. Silwood2]